MEIPFISFRIVHLKSLACCETKKLRNKKKISHNSGLSHSWEYSLPTLDISEHALNSTKHGTAAQSHSAPFSLF